MFNYIHPLNYVERLFLQLLGQRWLTLWKKVLLLPSVAQNCQLQVSMDDRRARYEPSSKYEFLPGDSLTVRCGDQYWIGSKNNTSVVTKCLEDGTWTVEPTCMGTIRKEAHWPSPSVPSRDFNVFLSPQRSSAPMKILFQWNCWISGNNKSHWDTEHSISAQKATLAQWKAVWQNAPWMGGVHIRYVEVQPSLYIMYTQFCHLSDSKLMCWYTRLRQKKMIVWSDFCSLTQDYCTQSDLLLYCHVITMGWLDKRPNKRSCFSAGRLIHLLLSLVVIMNDVQMQLWTLYVSTVEL